MEEEDKEDNAPAGYTVPTSTLFLLITSSRESLIDVDDVNDLEF